MRSTNEEERKRLEEIPDFSCTIDGNEYDVFMGPQESYEDNTIGYPELCASLVHPRSGKSTPVDLSEELYEQLHLRAIEHARDAWDSLNELWE